MGNNPPRFSETQIPDNISRVSMFFCLFAPLRPRTEDNSAIFWFTNSTVISASSSNRGFSWRLMVVWRRVLIGDAYITMTGLKIHPVQEHSTFAFGFSYLGNLISATNSGPALVFFAGGHFGRLTGGLLLTIRLVFLIIVLPGESAKNYTNNLQNISVSSYLFDRRE